MRKAYNNMREVDQMKLLALSSIRKHPDPQHKSSSLTSITHMSSRMSKKANNNPGGGLDPIDHERPSPGQFLENVDGSDDCPLLHRHKGVNSALPESTIDFDSSIPVPIMMDVDDDDDEVSREMPLIQTPILLFDSKASDSQTVDA